MLANMQAVGRFARCSFGEAFGVMTRQSRKAPDGEVRSSERGNLSDVLYREAKPVVFACANSDRNINRDIQGRNDEGQKSGFSADWFKIEQRRGS